MHLADAHRLTHDHAKPVDDVASGNVRAHCAAALGAHLDAVHGAHAANHPGAVYDEQTDFAGTHLALANAAPGDDVQAHHGQAYDKVAHHGFPALLHFESSVALAHVAQSVLRVTDIQ